MSKNQGIIHGFKVFVCYCRAYSGFLVSVFQSPNDQNSMKKLYYVTEVNSRFLRELCKNIHTDAFSACTTKNAMEIYWKPR